MSRLLILVLALTAPLAAFEPPVSERLTLLWGWSGRCSSPSCDEEERQFLATTALYYQVQLGVTTSTVEWRHDGTLFVDREPLTLSSRQRSALSAALEAVRDDLKNGGSTWNQAARVLPDGAQFLLAFSLDERLHAVSALGGHVPKEYLPLLDLLQELVDPASAARRLPADDETRIIGYRVMHDMPDHLSVEVEYFYDGSSGANVFVGANPVNETGVVMTGYRPNRIARGRHKTCTVVTTYSESPEEFTTDVLKIELYVGGGSVFHEVYVPLKKDWRKSELADQSCCDWCSRGCSQ